MVDTQDSDSTKLTNVAVDNEIDFDEQAAAPGTPSTAKVRLYAKSDGKLYYKDDAGVETSLDTALNVLKSLFDANTILAADSDDTPAAVTIAEQRLVGRITAGNITALTATQGRTLLNVEDGADVTDATNVDAAGAVMEVDFDANTVLAATSDDTPAAVTIAEQRIAGRITGANIAALTAAQVWTILRDTFGVPEIAGFYYAGATCLSGAPSKVTNFVIAQDRLYAVPFITLGAVFDDISVNIATAEAAKSIRMGIYEWDDTNNEPGALVYGSGAVAIDANGDKTVSGIAQTLAAGRYFLALLSDATGTGAVTAMSNTTWRALPPTTISTSGNQMIYKDAVAFGALPDPFPASPTFSNAKAPFVVLSV